MAIQGLPLEITVVGCTNLKDKEWFSRQDPYVVIEYAHTKFRTRTCTDGGRNPTFNEKFVLTMIEGLREVTVHVWNSNTLTADDFIGSGKIQLHSVLTNGYDNNSCPIKNNTSARHTGDVNVIMHFANAKNQSGQHTHGGCPPAYSYAHPAPHSCPPPAAYTPPPPPYNPYYAPQSYPPPASYPLPVSYPPPPASYPPAYPPAQPANQNYYPGNYYPGYGAPPPSGYPYGYNH